MNEKSKSKDAASQVAEVSITLSLQTRYLWEIAPALSKLELRNELRDIQALVNKLTEAIERA